MDAKANEDVGSTKQPPTDPPVARPRTRRRLVWYAFGFATALAAGSASWWYSCGFRGCPSVAQLQAWRPTEGGALLDMRGALLAPLAPVKRVNVPITKIPKHVQAAFVAVEDRRFYTHHGIDWRGFARGVVEDGCKVGVELILA